MSTAAKTSTIKTAILATFAALPPPELTMKKNKLRKLICDKLCKTLKVTWDEYDEVVKVLVSDKKLKETEEEDGLYLQIRSNKSTPSSSSASAKVSSSASSNPSTALSTSSVAPPASSSTSSVPPASSSDAAPAPPAAPPVSVTVTIPTLIAVHLQKNGNLKQKNIETNTKTVLKVVGDTSVRNQTPTSTVKLVVSSAPGATEPQKRVDAALVFVRRFDFAVKKNPAHFGFPDNKAATTMPNIDEMPKSEEGGKKRDGGDEKKEGEEAKKKQRKFY